tara:strand:+ start:234 stop:746 length:513 start_codon:yes stop_codon:yes gene_type:complete
MNLIQEDNFFPELDYLLPQIKHTKLYTQEETRKILKTDNVNWPGKRSLPLNEVNPILHEFIKCLINEKNLLERGNWRIASFLHLRLEGDNEKDWIHTDEDDLAALIYLSNTNLNSGTNLYDKNDNLINDIKFVKNRFVMYTGSTRHMGYGHHGNSIDNGRLTINLFLNRA